MRSIIAILAAASFLVVGIPFATADETDPDCEAGQPLIGYRSTLFVRDILAANGYPGGLYVCEGEHWDGQDTVQPGRTAACPGPSTSTDPNNLFVGACAGADPNDAPSQDPLNPVAVRVSSANGNEVYTSVNIAAVGRAVVYVGPEMSAVYLRDNTPGNVLATIVSAARITQGTPGENDCSQEVYHAGAMSGVSQCRRDNTAITVTYALP